MSIDVQVHVLNDVLQYSVVFFHDLTDQGVDIQEFISAKIYYNYPANVTMAVACCIPSE